MASLPRKRLFEVVTSVDDASNIEISAARSTEKHDTQARLRSPEKSVLCNMIPLFMSDCAAEISMYLVSHIL